MSIAVSHRRSRPHLARHLPIAAVVLAVGCTGAEAAQMVVVHRNGQAHQYTMASKSAAATAAACSDSSVAFAFVADPRDGAAVELSRSGERSRDIVIDVDLTCSNVTGSAQIPFDAAGGTAQRGVDYTAVPGVALLDLGASNPAPVAAPVRIDLLDNPSAGGATLTFSIVRRDGSFQGQFPGGSPIVGAIPGSPAALVAVSITGQVLISDAVDNLPRIDPAANEVGGSTTQFCQGAGRGSAGCSATQTAADRLADPSLSPAEREVAAEVLENNLRAIAPDETTALMFAAPRLASGQVNNVAQRLQVMRSGATTSPFSTSGLSLAGSSGPMSLSLLPTLLGIDDDESARNEEQRDLLGGTRLGLWVNGTIGSGRRDRHLTGAGYDSDTWELTSGLDYRFSDRFFAGIALGYSSLSTDFDDAQGSLDADVRSLHAYAGYSLPNGFSLDGSLSLLRGDYSQDRVIELYSLDPSGIGYTSLGRQIAHGETTVDQVSGSLGLTWTFMREAWTIAPQAQLSLMRTTYDAFRETGPSTFNLDYARRTANSRSFSFGAYVDRAYATSIGTFRPYGRAFWYLENGSTKDLIAEFAFANPDGSHTPLRLSTYEADGSYGSVELGVGLARPIGTRTVDFNFGLMQLFGYSGWDRWAARFDLRIPL